MVPDPADRATIEEEHALELRTRDRQRKLIAKIDAALRRIDDGEYGYCEVTGEPIYPVDMQLLGTDGDHNTAGLKATAMRIVNAVPAVVAGKPGLLTALDLPLITGEGLVRT